MTDNNELLLRDFRPQPKLVVKETSIEKPRFPVIDAHNHLGRTVGNRWEDKPLSELLDILDEAGVQVYVDLDGGWGEDVLHRHLDYFKAVVPERFCMFGGVEWAAWAEQGDSFGEWAAGRLRDQVARGAQGLKIWKPFGLSVRDHHDKLVRVNDPRLDPVWATASELNIPVLMHVADPVAFFDPLDNTNERYEELQRHPDWQFTSPPYPPFMQIMNDMADLIRRHASTTFICAHVGCYAENLGWVGGLMDECPNFHIDISARIAELGRQPYTARRFFIQHADRILFGTDSSPSVDTYRVYYRFLETDDEYFNYSSRPVPGQGRWQIYGLYLPDEVLEQVYYGNAERVILRRGR